MPVMVFAIDPDSGLAALYVNGSLVWDFGPNDPFRGALGLPNGWGDALPEIAEALGVDYDTESRHPVAHKMWTDYGWEWDSEWPQQLADAPIANDPVEEPA